MRKLYALVAGLFIVLVTTKTNGQLSINPVDLFFETSNTATVTSMMRSMKPARQILKLVLKHLPRLRKNLQLNHGIANSKDLFIYAGNLAMVKTLVFNIQTQIPALIRLFIIISNRVSMKFV
jgi:hypothetical protein